MSFPGTQKALMSGLGVPGIPQVIKMLPLFLPVSLYILAKLENASKDNERTKHTAAHKCTQTIKQKPNKPHYVYGMVFILFLNYSSVSILWPKYAYFICK